MNRKYYAEGPIRFCNTCDIQTIKEQLGKGNIFSVQRECCGIGVRVCTVDLEGFWREKERNKDVDLLNYKLLNGTRKSFLEYLVRYE